MKALKLRRITAFVMALVMLMPFICVPVFAANPTFTVENTTVTDGKVRVNLQVYENVPAFVQCEIEDLTTGVYDYYYPFGSSPKTDLLRQSSASFEVPLKECGRYNFSVFVTYNNGASGYGCEAVTVLYAPENAAAAADCGVIQTDSPSPRTADMTDDGTYIIVEDSNIGYLFYGCAPDYEVQEIAFLSADGTAVKTEDLKWDRTQNRWSSANWLKYTDFSGAVKAEIRAKRDPSKKSTLKLAIAQRGSIGSPKAEFTAYKERTYDAWFYSGSSFLITPTYTGKLYIDGKADERNVGVFNNGELLSDYITGRGGYLSPAVLNKRGWYRDGKATYGGNYSYISGMGKDDKWRTPTVYQAVRPGTVINCSFYGTEADGWSGKIVVSYTDTSEKEITLEKACSSSYGKYTASFSVPNDCMQINSIEYRLYNNYNFLAASQKTEYDALFCKGIVEFTDVPNAYKKSVTDVGYDTLMTFTNKQTGKISRMLIDYDRITTMAGLVPGEYDYEITKSGRHIHSGTITVADEFYQTFSFGTGGLGVPEALGYVTANISSASQNDGKAVRAAVALEVITPDGKTSSTSQTAEADGTLNFGTYPQGSTIKAKISFDADNYPLIEGFTPGEITQVLGYSYNFAFNASAFKKRTVSGTVCGGTSADNKKISNANVIITQTLPLLDGTEHTVTYSGKTDENGNFKIKNVADGTTGTIEIRAAGYAPKTIALDAYSYDMGISGVFDNWTTLAGTVYLDYLGELSIVSALKKEPEKLLGADGTAAKDDDGNTIGSELGDSMLNADASLVDIDNIVIGGATYRRGTDWIEESSGEQSIITFNDPSILSSAAAGGKTVTVNYIRPAYGTFNIDGELMSLRSFAVDAKFDAGRNVMAQAVAYKPKADIRVTACEKNEEGLVGFAVLSAGTISFTENGSPAEEMRILAWEGGVGELSLEPRVSDYTGSCTLYTFTVRQEDANVMRQLLRCGRPRLLNAVDTSGVFVKTNVTPRPNSVVMLGKKIPARTYSDIGLGPYSFDYIAEPYSEDVNYAVVRGVISKRDTSQLNKDMLFAVTLENKGGSGKAEFLVNGEESHSDGTWYNVLNKNHIPRPVLSTVVYALVPYKAETNTIDFDIQINTTDDGYIQKAERFNIVETVDNFDITLPEDRVHIQDKMRENGWYEGCGQLYDWLLDVDVAASKSLDKRENTITVWDNGTAIGTVDAENLNGVTRCGFKLTNMFAPGTHVIYATRETAVGNTYSVVSTPKRTVEVSADEKEIYVTDMVWYHNGQARSGGTMSVNPKMRSIIIFKVNGALSTDLDEVYVHTDAGVSIPAYCYYNDSAKNSSWWAIGGGAGIASDLSTFRTGYEGYLDSSRVLPVADKWGVMLGTAKDFTVDIGYTTPEKSSADRETLREQALRNYYDLMGLEVPDYDKRLEAIEEWKNSEDNDLNAYIEGEKQSMPSEIAELEYSLDVSTDGKTFTYTAAPTASVSSATLVMKFGDEKEYKLSELYTRLDKEREGDITEDAGFDVMWSAAESAQGLTIKRFAVKNEELLVNGKKQYHSIMHETLYLPSEVRDAMYEAAGANNVFLDAYSDDDAPLTVLADEDTALSVYAAKKTKAKTDDDGDPMLKTAYDYTNEVYSAVDLVNAAKTSNAIVESAALGNTAAQIEADAKAAGFIPDSVGYVAKGLCVVDTAYNIHKGPSGKSGDALWDRLMHIKDRNVRMSISRDIQDYEELRVSSYGLDCFVKVATCAAGFSNPKPGTWASKAAFAVSLGLYLGGKAYDKIRGWAGDYQKDTYNTLQKTIDDQIRFERYKAEAKQAKAAFIDKLRRTYGYVSQKRVEEEMKYYVLVRVKGKLKYVLKSKLPKLQVYIDPSGYVFEAVENNRVSGITATIYRDDGSGVYETPWTDPNTEEPQENPQTTTAGEGDVGGRYGWMVPSGDWKVKFTDPNGMYEDAETNVIQVPPEHTNVNIGLLSAETPTVKISEKDGKIVLSFSKYMRLDTLIKAGDSKLVTYNESGVQTSDTDTSTSYDDESFDYTSFAITLLDANGRQIKGSVSFPDKAPNTGYTPYSPYQTDWIYCDYFVKTAVFTPAAGSSTDNVKIKVGAGVTSYSGAALPEDTEAVDSAVLTVTNTSSTGSATSYSTALNTGEKCVVIATSYNNDGSIYAVETAYASNGSTDITVAVPYSGARVVIRTWDSLSNMKPLSEPYVTTG